MRSRFRWWMVPITILILAGVWLVFTIDDWSRDFTTNVAETSQDARNELLRPVTTALATDRVVEAVRRAAKRLGAYEYVGDSGDGDTLRLLFVRTSPVWRFKDDVTVRIHDRDGVRVVTAESRSRVGRGDLGQNPRNIAALLGELKAILAEE